jgi:succinate-semialdehyde dehydrogenase/glutarate-semialdehyde dehydrogenase
VQDGIYTKFANLLTEKVNQFVTGDPLQQTTTIGSLINKGGIEKVERHVQDALSKGAKILTGGQAKQGKGYYYSPTVMTEVMDECTVSTEETFGPLAALFRFQSEEEVVKRANDSIVGLAGYVYTTNIDRLHRVSEALAVGLVAVNTGIISQPCIPFGGVKGSGFGREGGKGGIDEYMSEKVSQAGHRVGAVP